MNKKINWGIIGCGVIADSHAKAVIGSEKTVLAAVCDIIPEKAKKLADLYNAEKIYDNYNDLLADSNIDAVSICTPSGMHGQMVQDAAAAGKHILCEKPMEITSDKMDALINAVDKAGVKMGCVFQRRLLKEAVAVKEALDSGRFGRVILADAYLKYYRSPEYYRSADWRATWEWDGGGALMNQGIHGIDLLTWLVGDVESVFARCATQIYDFDVEDTAIASLKFKNGAVGNIEGTTSVYPAQDTRFEIHCERGSIIFGDAGIKQWKLKDSIEEAPSFDNTDSNVGIKDDPTKLSKFSHLPFVDNLADAIINDKSPMIMPRDARKAVDLILAIYKSSNEKREIII